ncbi:hypothetical protein AVEN_22459-1 [Araneus ventricosus]|uniref:Ig-like domain-containing protein n=1 Tax=Araneus ventricosus TaxID=182803 RepID=A0A4Y2NSZ5_ARAVE|nr:hypothetical protein AVEN_22459-1 [Araneus ventricosus]
MVTEKTKDQLLFFPPQTGAKNKIKLRLPSDSSYSKWICPSITSCYSDRRKLDMLVVAVLVAGRQIHAEHAEGDQVGLRLVFTNVEIEDAGTYTCSDDQDSVSFDLTVYRAVSFGDTPRIQHAPEGDTGVVLCNVKADPKPVVNWYFEGTKISNDKKYQIHPDNHSLKIHDLTRDDAGEYKCKAFVFTHLSSQIKDFDIKLHVQLKIGRIKIQKDNGIAANCISAPT